MGWLDEDPRKRKKRFDALNEYIGFASAKLAGIGLSTVGALESIAPDVIPAHISNPQTYFAAGLSLLSGKAVMSLLGSLVNANSSGSDSGGGGEGN